MPRDRLEDRFRDDATARRASLLPYFTSGFPDLATTAEFLHRCDALGVTCVELGFPYSDSVADGPVIQESFNQALAYGLRVDDTFEMVHGVRASVQCALIAMVAYSVVHRRGTGAFMNQAAEAGFDGIIVPDVPVEEWSATEVEARRAGLCYIGLVARTTSPSRRAAIASASSGFIYQIAAAGTTGERAAVSDGLAADVVSLRAVSGLPVCVGFGISAASQVRAVCRFADGAIVGSAIVRRIADGLHERLESQVILESVSSFLAELVEGARSAGR